MAETKLTPLKSIRAKCLDCCCGQSAEIKNCTVEKCPLYPYRLGKTGRTRTMTEEQKAAFVERVQRGKHNV